MDIPGLQTFQNMYPDSSPTERPETPQSGFTSVDQLMGMPIDSLVDMEIIDMVVGRKKVAEEDRQHKRERWDRCWRNYNQIYDSANKESWQSRKFQPMTTKVVEVIVSNLHAAIMGPDVPAEFQTKMSEFDDIVRKTNSIIQHDFTKAKVKAYWTDFLRTLAVCGSAIGKVDYIKEEETVMVKERQKTGAFGSFMQMMGMQQQAAETFTPRKMLVKNYARFRNVDIYDIYVQPKVPEFGKNMWVIEKGKITNKELIDGMNDPDPYYRLDNISEELLMSGSARSLENDPEKAARRIAFGEYTTQMHFLEPDKEHELLEYWGPIPAWFLNPELRNDPVKKYQTIPGWIWVVDGKYVVRKRINPFRDAEPPYIKGDYIRLPGKFYGLGPAEIIMDLQTEKNEIWNTRMDNVNLILNKIVAVLKDHVHDWKRLRSGPGAIWIFKGIDDIRKAMMPVDFSNIVKDSYQAEALIDNEVQEVTGAVKATLAVGGDQNEAGGGTFRGQLLNKQVATERFMLYARLLEVCGLNDAYRKFYQRIYQYKDYDSIRTIIGKEDADSFEFIPPEELDKVAILVPLGVLTMETKGVKLAQMEVFTKLWGNREFFKPLEMARQMYYEMGYPSADTVLFSDQEMEQFMNVKKQLMGEGAPTPPSGAGGPPGLLGPNGRPLAPISGNVPSPMNGMPRPPMPARGPGASPIDLAGMPPS